MDANAPARPIEAAARRAATSTRLRLPEPIRACLFDLDGVLTDTARVHAAAWKEAFDAFLHERARAEGGAFVPFDLVGDYDRYVDGRPRLDGVRSFLASREIELRDLDTLRDIAGRKNALVLAILRRDGVRAFDGSVRFVRAVRDAGLKIALVTASANCDEVLAAAGVAGLFEVRIDGRVAARDRLRGKPAPDTYLEAARRLETPPAETAVFEDALAGVAAGRAGRFGLVVGVDRVGQASALQRSGAHIVVGDLAELLGP